MNRFWELIGKIDRRIIYLFVFIGVLIPLLGHMVPGFKPSPEVVQAYNEINSLPEGSIILISIDYDAASMPELQPLLEAMLMHIFERKLKVIMMGHWPLGLPLGQIALEKIASQFNKVYGEDYVFLGYRPGLAAVMLNMGKEIRTVFDVDYRGTKLDDLPMMRNVHNYNDIALLVGYEAGSVGDFWVQFAQARFRQKIILAATAVVWPDLYPYLQAHQIVGLIGGMRGAADYEILVKRLGSASTGMASQTLVHVLVIAFILLGNIGYYFTRRRKD